MSALADVGELDFARLELRAAGAYLNRRIAIATVKQEHGLLTADEQDDIIIDVKEWLEQVRVLRQSAEVDLTPSAEPPIVRLRESGHGGVASLLRRSD